MEEKQPAAGVGTHLASVGVKPEPLRSIPPPLVRDGLVT